MQNTSLREVVDDEAIPFTKKIASPCTRRYVASLEGKLREEYISFGFQPQDDKIVLEE